MAKPASRSPKPPLVSVIVRSVDRPELKEALASIAAQTYEAIEVVLVAACADHAAPPATCGGHPIRFVGSATPLTRPAAGNAGLDAATGRYLVFLDDDDLFLPGHVAALVEALDVRPEARAAFAGVEVRKGDQVIDVYDAAFDPVRLIAWNHLPTAGVMIDRAVRDAGVRFDESLDIYEDWDFWLQVARVTPFARSEGISAIYRPHLGRSGMVDPARERELAAARRQVWAKWLPQLAPETFEALVGSLRNDADKLMGRLHVAVYRERENAAIAEKLQALLDYERAAFNTEREGIARLLEEERAALNAERSGFVAEREDLRGDADALRQSLAAIRASTAWRMTAPLRWALERARGQSRRP